MNILNLLIFVPLLAATAILLGTSARRTALGASVLNLILSLIALSQYQPGGDRFQFLSVATILPDLDLKYFVGADGLSLLMILLTAIVTLAAVWVSPRVERMEKQFYACVLFIAAGAMGAFASLDLFFFYAFHELALIPTFLMIGIWGSGDRHAAAWKITIYLAVGSFILLVGLIGLYLAVPETQRTFDLTKLMLPGMVKNISASAHWIYPILLTGFGILISLFPFHTWAPDAYASAPAPVAMLHAGVLKKFGLYGLLRVALPLMPDAAREWSDLLLVLLVGNVLYVGLATIAQKRLDLMLGYSSVMHMGYIFLGIASFNFIGLSGAALLMFAHGLAIAALFALTGQLRDRTGTVRFSELGGLAKPAPVLGFLFALAAFASIGLPGFANFSSEILVLFGAFGAQVSKLVPVSGNPIAPPPTFTHFQVATVCALWGVVISAVYMLRGFRAVFLGELDKRWAKIPDLARTIRWPVILLLATLMLGGFIPRFFLKFVQPTFEIFAPR